MAEHEPVHHGALAGGWDDERCTPQHPCAECFRHIEAYWSRQVAHLLTSVRRVDQKYGPYAEFAHWRNAPVSLAEGAQRPAVPCSGRAVSAEDDEVTFDCLHHAVVECRTIHGQWEPLCDLHATGYVQNGRTRPLGGTDG
jgi:hypothetical protein